MDRREFVIGSGAVLTAAMFIQACGRAKGGPRPLSSGGAEDPPIIEALRYGITAPSAHNTQPWRIELVSDTEARLFLDRERLLPLTDPPGRQVHMSHGTLLEMTAIAATHFGYRADIDPLPDGGMDYEQLGTKPTARIRLAPVEGEPEDPLFAQALTRRSSRLAHEGPMVTDGELASMVDHARPGDLRMGLVPESQLAKASDLVVRAMTIEVNDYEIYDETRFWFRFSKREMKRHQDGLSVNTAGLTGFAAGTANMFLSAGNWHKEKNRKRYLATFRETIESTRGFLTMVTPTNTMLDWLHAGRVYVRAQLAASALGLRFHPVSQALQEYPQMDALRGELDALLGVEPPAKVQMFVRVGRTQTPGLSPRRSLDALLT